ncbi:MAG: hypothetical protein WBH03_20380, partial [Cyclobacteriaceae bacterium]
SHNAGLLYATYRIGIGWVQDSRSSNEPKTKERRSYAGKQDGAGRADEKAPLLEKSNLRSRRQI